MIVVLGNIKGGEGKSTIAINLACMLKTYGKDALLVDADPQESSYTWSVKRSQASDSLQEEGNDPLTLVPCVCQTGNIKDQLLLAKEKYDYIVVDTQGRSSMELTSSLLTADVLVLPISYSFLNLNVLSQMNKLLETTTMVNPDLRILILTNKANTHSSANDQKSIEEAINGSPALDLLHNKMAETVIHNRMVFSASIGYGLSVIEMPESNQKERDFKVKGQSEIKDLYNEVFSV